MGNIIFFVLRDTMRRINFKKYYPSFFIIGAILWFCVRVIPKPSRINYPCQRTLLPIITTYIKTIFPYIIGFLLVLSNFVQKRKGVIVVSALLIFSGEEFKPVYKDIKYGTSIPHVHRIGRVHSDDATNWNFATGYYWQYVEQSIIDKMVEKGVMALVGDSTPERAWQKIMSYYNNGDEVAIKINGNCFWSSTSTGYINTVPQIVNSIIKGLKSIEIPESLIYVIEPTPKPPRRFPIYYSSIINNLYPNVKLFDADDCTFDSGGASARVNFSSGAASQRISDLIVTSEHLIIVPIMKAHQFTQVGSTGAIKMMQGVIQDPGVLHSYLGYTTGNPDVEIYMNTHIIDKTRLIITDGLFGNWYRQDGVPKPWLTFPDNAPDFLFFGIDPVAIDGIVHTYIGKERAQQGVTPLTRNQIIAGANAGLGIHEIPDSMDDCDTLEYVKIELTNDTIPPQILNVRVDSIIVDTAIIKWESNEPSYSEVEYGTSTNYGRFTRINTELADSHTHFLYNLSSDSTYHYRVINYDSSGNISISIDYQFSICVEEREMVQEKMIIYPNPCYFRSEIIFKNLTKGTKLKIYDISGKLIKVIQGNYEITWNIKDISSGVYIICYINDRRKEQKHKLIIIN